MILWQPWNQVAWINDVVDIRLVVVSNSSQSEISQRVQQVSQKFIQAEFPGSCQSMISGKFLDSDFSPVFYCNHAN